MKSKKNIDVKSKEITKIIIAIGIGIILGIIATLVAIWLNDNYITNYKTFNGIKRTVQKGIPTYCEFHFVNGKNGYEGENYTEIIAIDIEKSLFYNESKYLSGSEVALLNGSLHQDGWVYNWSSGSFINYDEPSYKIKQDSNEFITSYAFSLFDKDSVTYYLTTSDNFKCRKAKEKDYNLPKDIQFIEGEREIDQ